ncbi:MULTISPECIES: TetR/AcrR family transcriptional regulator [Paraburkholderia]|jgi:AcrR family transcriptional regulator|uniref:TetR/AcrR family transcriptional regulator n=1 Tax=Paraburkholderia TaxID=1822464 RepID=UPI0022581C0E|nr:MULTISPECIES: TetR/AcrR family transcriptional regulator [Paraburkholderia]MCX4156657.1 TetR/AcrR family transcriptional regulator [Paraburkholderia aspalathi]MDN7166062.1 TetR/AcrR family transcriptional regulator [Paraburkholderia sp. SECH2]MDQ6394548.1 TetR/AcrR family transcriptional regulator [Paraburkholderia aspalathi]
MSTAPKQEKPQRAPARRTQEERSDATRRRIVQSAMRLLHKKGFRATNLQDIARGARVTLGALQHHFANRQVLMERLIDEVMAPLSDDGVVWPPATLPLDERAKEFVRLAWQTIYGVPSYVAAWSLFFGCKASPELFERIDATRARSDPVFFSRFITCFPEIEKNHPAPEQFAGFVFATLRGMGLFGLFDVAQAETDGQLGVLVQVIVQAGQRHP